MPYMERGGSRYDRYTVSLPIAPIRSVKRQRNAKAEVQALYLRGCLTIRNHDKKKTEQSFVSENKHPISQDIRLWDSLLSAGFGDLKKEVISHGDY